MIKLIPTVEQQAYAYKQAYWYEYGKRKDFNGNKTQKLVGILAQTIVADYLHKDRPNGENGFDGGVDMTVNGKTIDVKCMTRKCDVLPNYSHNIVGYQAKYEVDFYMFTSFNLTKGELSICGVMDKQGFMSNADYFHKGELIERADKPFVAEADMYVVSQNKLLQVDTLEDIERIFLYGDR